MTISPGASTHYAPYRHNSYRLKNELELITVAMPHLHSTQVALLVRVGSRHERPQTNGLSHMLEHMFFRGCEGFADSTALNAAIEDLGGHLDGYTTRDHSAYPITVHPRYVREAIELLGQMFRAPQFQDIDIEREIILEEMLEVLDARGREIEVDTLSHQLHFGDHGLGQSIEGPRKNVRRFSVEDLQAHRRRFYGTRNMILCIAGALDEDECRRYAEQAFSGLHVGRRSSDGRAPRAPKPGFRSRRTDESQTRLRLTFRTMSASHSDYPAMALLRRVLDGGLSARLPSEMIERRGLVYEIAADLLTYADSGTFDIELAVAHRKSAIALRALGEILAEIRDQGVDQAELDRVRNRVQIGLELGLDSVHEMVQWYGIDHLFGCAMGPQERLAQLEKVQPEDVQRVARKYLRGDRLTVVAVGGAGPKSLGDARRALRTIRQEALT